MRFFLRPVCWIRGAWWSLRNYPGYPISGHLGQDQGAYEKDGKVFAPSTCMTCGLKLREAWTDDTRRCDCGAYIGLEPHFSNVYATT